jgi:uncharacterized membrane protein
MAGCTRRATGLLFAAVALVLLPASGAAAAEAPIELPLPAGGSAAMALGVNAAGMVVGSASDATSERAVAWIPRGRDRYTAVDLDGVAGASLSQADAVNSAGVVVGFAAIGAGAAAPELWAPDGRGGYLALHLPPAGAPGRASAIDSRGVVAGEIDVTGLRDQAVVWTPDGHGAYGPPTALDALSPGLPSAAAVGVDRTGVVAGTSFNSSLGDRAVAWTPARGGARTAIDLGTLPGGVRSIASGIGAAGVVAGFSDGGSGFGGAVWRPNGRGGYDAAEELSPLPGGTFAFLNGISGIVAGSSNTGADPGSQHATIWLPRGGAYRPVDLSGPGGVANATAGDFVAGTRVPPASPAARAVVWRLAAAVTG